MSIVSDDYRAVAPVVKDLGTFSINFVSGSTKDQNDRVRSDYKLYETIINIFQPKNKSPGMAVPLLFSGILVVAFVAFFVFNLVKSPVPLNLVHASSASAVFFISVYLAVFGVIIMFWL
jgi:hypothetical protein